MKLIRGVLPFGGSRLVAGRMRTCSLPATLKTSREATKVLFALLTITAGLARQVHAQNGLTNGLVLALGMDEGSGTVVNDSSYWKNHGYFSNVTWSTTGYYSNCILFKTNSSMVMIDWTNVLDDFPNGITIEMWVYPMTYRTTAWSTLIFHGDEDHNNVEYIINGTCKLIGGAPSFWAVNSHCYGTNLLPLNTWTHVAATYDNHTKILYTNGVINGVQQTNATMSPNPNFPVTIGGNTFYPNESWGGKIDEVRIYNRCLTRSEITNDMATPVYTLGMQQPSIIQQPQGVTTAVAGSTVTFVVTASGTPPLSYQWRFNSASIPSATNAFYELQGVGATNTGSYSVVVTNLAGSVTSSNALLTVIIPPTLGLQLQAGYPLLHLNGMLSSNFVVQYSTNLAGTNWAELLSLTNLPSSPYLFLDPAGDGEPARLYRAFME